MIKGGRKKENDRSKKIRKEGETVEREVEGLNVFKYLNACLENES
jgi:hypothetical protein